MILLEELDIVKHKLAKPSNTVILSHRNPDGDALGSSLAMALALRTMGHQTKIILPSEFPNVFEYLPSLDEIIIYDLKREEAKKILESAEILVCLDFNSLDRVDPLAPIIQESKAYKLLLDHHLDPEPFSDFYLSDTDASSTCELVYRFFEMIGQVKRIDVNIATCLFTGILTDTGSFKYATNPEVYRIAAELKRIGVDDYAVNDAIFNCWTDRQMRILGHSLRNRMEIIPELGAGIIALNKHDYKNYQIARGDTEGLVNYILMIKGMKVAAFIRQMPTGEIRLSLRSKGDISVQELARDHFNGGGHKNASGGSSDVSLADTIQKFKSVLPFYLS